MIQFKDQDIEEARKLIISIRQLIKERQYMVAGHRLIALNDILLNGKEMKEMP
jgi:hypothetical protein